MCYVLIQWGHFSEKINSLRCDIKGDVAMGQTFFVTILDHSDSTPFNTEAYTPVHMNIVQNLFRNR